MIKIFLVFYLLSGLFGFSEINAQEAAIDINKIDQSLGLRNSFSVYIDSSQILNQNNVKAYLGLFKPPIKPSFNTHPIKWLKINLENKINDSQVFELFYIDLYASQIEVFELLPGEKKPTIINLESSFKTDLFHRTLYFKPNQTIQILIKLVQKHNTLNEFDFLVLEKANFEKYLSNQRNFDWYFLGFCFAILCLSGLSYFFLKQLTYLFYFFFVIFYLISLLLFDGIFLSQFDAIPTYLKSFSAIHFSISLSEIFNLLYLSTLLKIRNDTLLRWFILINIVLVLAVIFFNQGIWSSVYINIQTIIFFINFFFLLHIFKKSYPKNKSFTLLIIISILPIFIMTNYMAICKMQLTPSLYYNYNILSWFKITCIVEILVLMCASLQHYVSTINKKNNFRVSLIQAQYNEKKAHLKERERIANDLHDEFSNSLLALKNYIKSETKDDKLEVQINDLVKQMRKITHNLATVDFNKISLNDSIDQLLENFNNFGAVFFEFESHGISKIFPNDKNIDIYRITMEGINNVLKHANATNCKIQFTYHAKELIILIEDNGSNYSGTDLLLGLGLKSIKKRVLNLEGTVSFDSNPTGFVVSIILPN